MPPVKSISDRLITLPLIDLRQALESGRDLSGRLRPTTFSSVVFRVFFALPASTFGNSLPFAIA